MATLDGKILDRFLEKYEKSVLSKREAKVNISLSLSAKDPVFKPYSSSPDPAEHFKLDSALERLCRQGLITVEKKNGIFLSAKLNLAPNKIREDYLLAERVDPALKEAEYLPLLDGYVTSEDAIVKSFVESMKQDLADKKLSKAESYFENGEELKEILLALSEMAQLENVEMERDFSVRVFHDSKRFGKLRGKIDKIIRAFSDTDYDDDDDPVEDCGVSKNRMYAYVKNGLKLEINNQTIDLDAFGEELALSDSTISEMKVVSSRTKALMTVENLTTFYEMKDPEYTYVYLGGYHNKVRQSLILKIAQAVPGMSFYHYGDLDPDGFAILVNLRKKTGLPFIPYLMDQATLEKYASTSRLFEKHDRDKILKELVDPDYKDFYGVLDEMSSKGYKLEQEIIQGELLRKIH